MNTEKIKRALSVAGHTCLVTAAATLIPAFTGTARSQTAEETASEAGKLKIPALERYEKQRRLFEEKKFEMKRAQQLHDVQLLVQRASLRQDPEEKILSYLRAASKVEDMWREQPDPSLKRLFNSIYRKIYQIPPPDSFKTAQGIRMQKVSPKRGDAAFYISAEPVNPFRFPVFTENLDKGVPVFADVPDPRGAGETAVSEYDTGAPSWTVAQRFCAWLATISGTEVRLPTLDEVRACCPESKVALWTGTAWNAELSDPKAARMRIRFATPMYAIWDPARLLDTETVMGELCPARYPELGVRIIMPLKAGIMSRIADVREQL